MHQVPRHAVGVFIDDIVGSIGLNEPLSMGSSGMPMLGGNCSVARAAAEAGQGARMDRTCEGAYGGTEDPAVTGAAAPWTGAQFTRWLHALHYRDLYRQKLAYVRGYLGATGADRLAEYDTRAATGDFGFLVPTADAAQYYDEGADGRCAAYDPFNKRGLEAEAGSSHLYTIQSLEFGRCGSCSSAEKVTPPLLTWLNPMGRYTPPG